jgi:hypothetical protein
MDKTVVTPEGWVVTDLKTFRLVVDHPPPRPNCYLHQFLEDARDWKPITVWVIGIGTITVGVAAGWWWLLPFGVALLLYWLIFFLLSVRTMRVCPVAVGQVGALEPHPLIRDFSTA